MANFHKLLSDLLYLVLMEGLLGNMVPTHYRINTNKVNCYVYRIATRTSP